MKSRVFPMDGFWAFRVESDSQTISEDRIESKLMATNRAKAVEAQFKNGDCASAIFYRMTGIPNIPHNDLLK